MNKKYKKYKQRQEKNLNINEYNYKFDSLFNDLSYKTVNYQPLTVNDLKIHFGDGNFINIMTDAQFNPQQIRDTIKNFREAASNKKDDWYIIYFACSTPGPDDEMTQEYLQEQIENFYRKVYIKNGGSRKNRFTGPSVFLNYWLLWNKFLKQEILGIDGENKHLTKKLNSLIVQGTLPKVKAILELEYPNVDMKYLRIPLCVIVKNSKIEQKFEGSNWFQHLTKYWKTNNC